MPIVSVSRSGGFFLLVVSGQLGSCLRIVFGIIDLFRVTWTGVIFNQAGADTKLLSCGDVLVFCGRPVRHIPVSDGGQAVMVNALRGAGGIWAPALIQNIAFMFVMLPLAWWLAIENGRGAMGLFEATLVATLLSLTMLSVRFRQISRNT